MSTNHCHCHPRVSLNLLLTVGLALIGPGCLDDAETDDTVDQRSTTSSSLAFLLDPGRLSADLTVVHLTDLHLRTVDLENEPDEVPLQDKIAVGQYKRHTLMLKKAPELLASAIALINTKIRPDFVVITGDIVDRATDVEAWSQASALLQKIQVPHFVIEGDHDFDASNSFGSKFPLAVQQQTVNGYAFFSLPYAGTAAKNTEWLNDLRGKVQAATGTKAHFLGMHRMLRAPALLKALAEWKCKCSMLAPNAEEVIQLLKDSSAPFIVLNGHSHTNDDADLDDDASSGPITQLTTASLAEYPFSLRVVKMKGNKLYTDVFSLDELQSYYAAQTTPQQSQ